MSQLSTVTLGWEVDLDQDDSLKPLRLIFEDLSRLHLGRLQWAPYLKNIGIELRFGESKNSGRAMALVDVLKDGLKEPFSALDRALANFKLSQCIISLQFQPHQVRDDAKLQNRLHLNFPILSRQNSLTVAVSGGKSVCLECCLDTEQSLGRSLATVQRHPIMLTLIAVSADSKWMATGSFKSFILWSMHGRRKTAAHVWSRGCDALPSFSPDGRRIAYQGSITQTITIRDTSLGSHLAALQIERKLGVINPILQLEHIAWSPDGARIIAGFKSTQGGMVAPIWDAETYARLHTISDIGHLLIQPGERTPDSSFYHLIDASSADGGLFLGVRYKKREEQGLFLFPEFGSVAADIWSVTTGIRVWHSDLIPLEDPTLSYRAAAKLDATGEKVAIWFSQEIIHLVRVAGGRGWLTLLHESNVNTVTHGRGLLFPQPANDCCPGVVEGF